tara:strand:+ start:44 stop:292 length:249 start_codon:yes stop_codon:yes gene_type:complete
MALALLFSMATISLVFLNEGRLGIFFSVYLAEYLVVTLVFVYFNPRARRLNGFLGGILLLVFLAMVTLKAAELLFGTRFGLR